MGFNGAVAGGQDVGDFTVRFALGNQHHHLAFALGEPIKGIISGTAR